MKIRTGPFSSLLRAQRGDRRGRTPVLAVEPLEDRSCPSVTIAFDYSLDSSGFFNDPGRRGLLAQAGQALGGQLTDSLAAVTPGGGNHWSIGFTNPSTGTPAALQDPALQANTLVVFVGARPLFGSEVGEGGYGSASAVGSTSWLQTVTTRGQSGALDFGPWGGSLAFDPDVNWYLGGTAGTPGADQFDFLSVAEHELGHLLGLGTAPSWTAQVSGGHFLGRASFAAQGGQYPALDFSSAHWAEGTTSGGQTASMTPVLQAGQRHLFTPLDFAGLQDVGWQVGGPVSAPLSAAGAVTGVPGATATAAASAQAGFPPPTQTAPPGVAHSGPGAFDPMTGTWYLRTAASAGTPDAGAFAFGGAGWVPVVGDWDGNGTTTVGVFDPATATWYLRNSNGAGAPDATFTFGAPGWQPVTGDWNGDGRTDVGVVDPTSGTWYLHLGAGPGAPDAGVFPYGGPGWRPVVGHWNGGPADGIGTVDPQTGTWYLRTAASSGAPNAGVFAYGAAGWRPVTGDWNGDGRTDVGAVDPQTGTWFLRGSAAAGAPDAGVFAYGAGGWLPVGGNWQGGTLAAAGAQASAALHAAVADALFRTGADLPAASVSSSEAGPSDPQTAALGWSGPLVSSDPQDGPAQGSDPADGTLDSLFRLAPSADLFSV